MRTPTLLTLAGLLLSGDLALAAPPTSIPTSTATVLAAPSRSAPQVRRRIDLVIALDTSSSMDGLIDTARQKLWDVVGLLGRAQPQPELRVGLVSYGNQGYSADAGWVRVDSDLSTDLDTLYSKLFALRTNGGDEYVARAVRDATRQLSWDQRSDTLKILFVAGNEPANQDPQVSLASALGEARQRGILVNTIYCGSTSATESAGWREVASLGHGEFAAIDQSRSVVEVAAPQDTELARLGRELNRTYLSYGADGGARAANQAAQDENAIAASPQAAAGRAVAKASSVYRNESWDVVDARKVKGSFLKDAPAAALPAPMRSMSAPEREAFVDKLESERTRIQARIQELSKERAKYLDAQAKQRSAGAAAADDALLAPLKKEAEKAGYAF